LNQKLKDVSLDNIRMAHQNGVLLEMIASQKQ